MASYRFFNSKDTFATLWRCQHCQLPISVAFETKDGHFDPDDLIPDSRLPPTPRYFTDNIRRIRIFPAPIKPEAPEHTPEPIAKAYRQGLGGLKRQEYEPCSMLMRKALDLTIKEISPTAKGALAARIKESLKAGRITADMAEWAQEIKDLGNDAAHDPVDVAKEDAEEITKFTELFLMYVFTLPGMLAERRRKSPPT
jgi:hypothetical protein